MSNAGSTRGHGDSHRREFLSFLQQIQTKKLLISYVGRDYRRSTNDKALADTTVPDFQSQRTPIVGFTRRHRGYQPDEVNKNPQKLELGASSIAQDVNNVTNPIVVDNHPQTSATNSRPGSTITLRSNKPVAPHQRTHIRDRKSHHQSVAHIQVATMDASRPELDLVHFDGVSEPIESEVSSTQIITERKPSCWSIASPPEPPPTEWNSTSANIDRPAPTKLPVYRMPKSERKQERDVASSFNRQQARLNSEAAKSTSKSPRPHEVHDLLRPRTPSNDRTQAIAHVRSQDDGHAAESLHHQFQQLQHDEQLDSKQISQIKAIGDEVLSRTMQASPGVLLESDELKTSSPAQDSPQANVLNSIASSTTPSQAKIEQVSASPGRQNSKASPHPRVQSACQGANNNNKSLPGISASLSRAITTKSITHDEEPKHRSHATSTIQVNKLPPHLQILSAVKTGASKDTISASISSPTTLKSNNSYRPTIDIDEEIAAIQSVLDIDEEIAAGLHADIVSGLPGAQSVNSNIRGTKEQVIYVPPHARASFSGSKASVGESKPKVNENEPKSQVDQYGDRNQSSKTQSNGFAVGSYAGAPQDPPSKQRNAGLASTWKNGAVPVGAESSIRKGKKPVRESESVDLNSELVDWDGKMVQPPVGDEWDRRRPFNPQSNERHSVIEVWREEHAADPAENNHLIVDTASIDFQTGEGLAGGFTNVLSPIDRRDHETLVANDEFTQARRHQSAAEAIKNYEAKLAAKPKFIPSGIEGMTREEKRRFRRALIEEERALRVLPNPHAPAANIYLRPAEFKDMGQITTIDNYYVRETNFVLHLDAVDELYWYVYFLSALSRTLVSQSCVARAV